MPVIGRAPRRSDVFFAFGHGHDGLGLAAVTGRVIAELVGDRPTSLDIAAFRADRFGWR
jgi:D-amino-acid dehydrogenase